MKKILEMLYNGEIDPGEATVPQDENYRLVARKIADEQDYFKQNLSEEDAERFEELKESLSIFSCMHSKQPIWLLPTSTQTVGKS